MLSYKARPSSGWVSGRERARSPAPAPVWARCSSGLAPMRQEGWTVSGRPTAEWSGLHLPLSSA